MRIQFSVTDEEHETLKELSCDYPDISSYCRDVSLGTRNYGEMWKTVVSKIGDMKKGETFLLRDLILVPPSNMGVKLFKAQKDLNIEYYCKTGGVDTYRKL